MEKEKFALDVVGMSLLGWDVLVAVGGSSTLDIYFSTISDHENTAKITINILDPVVYMQKFSTQTIHYSQRYIFQSSCFLTP
jgi:hypothetical protein